MKYLLLDTNIPLTDASAIITLGNEPGVTVVLPETVLAELDAKKSGFEEVNWQARATARLLANAKVVNIDKRDYGTRTELDADGNKILIIGLSKYVANPAEYGGNDQRIIETAIALQDAVGKDDEVVLMSIDYYMRLRAQSVGLKVMDYKIIEDADFQFVKEMVVEDIEQFKGLHDSPILSIDPDHKIENYSYKFTTSSTEQMKLATVSNGLIKVLGKETEGELRQQDCAPINAEQLLVSKAIQDPKIDLVMIEGQAGSGKNVVAVSNAIRLFSQNKTKYNSIIYIRNSINDEEKGEDIGYVSGNDEKYGMYLGPMEDTIDFITRNRMKRKSNEKRDEYELRVQDKIEELKKEFGMESIITTGLRGRTFHNAIIILDEWQNTSQATCQKVLTRIGKDCKVIVIGSQRQIDNKWVTKYNNGLAVLLSEARDRSIDTPLSMFAIELKKVVRSTMAEFGESLFSKKGRK